MTEIEQLENLQARQLELLAAMKKTDGIASKCTKLGKPFKDEYPNEYDDYIAANTEYNSNEADIERLKNIITNQKENSAENGLDINSPSNNQ